MKINKRLKTVNLRTITQAIPIAIAPIREACSVTNESDTAKQSF